MTAAAGKSGKRVTTRRHAPKSAVPKGHKSRTLLVELFGSVNGTPHSQRRIARALGLRRRGSRAALPDHASVRGMIRKIPHLVRIVSE